MINPIFLRSFCILAEERSFTRAAEVLTMSQPGVSQHLKSLEEYYGVPLISREGRHFELTDAGSRLHAYARSFLIEHERFRTSLAVDEPDRGLCRFASIPGFGVKMYGFLLGMNKLHPDLLVHFSYSTTAQVIRDVLEERIDVGFVHQLSEDGNLYAEAFAEERLCLALPKQAGEISWAKLRELGFINHPDGHRAAGRLLAKNFPDDYAGMEQFKVRGFSNQITNSILEPVALGMGFTVLPESACAAFAQRGKIRIETLAEPVADQIYWIQKPGRQLPSRFAYLKGEYLKKQQLWATKARQAKTPRPKERQPRQTAQAAQSVQ